MIHLTKKILCLLVLVALNGCDKEHKEIKPPAHIHVVAAKSLKKILHFSGTVAPIREHSIVSPMEAVIEAMNFHYGQRVKKGDVVLTLISTELQKQYNETLTDYLKAKDNFSVIQAKFNGTKELWHAGLISKNNYLSEKSGLWTSRITLMQAKRKLTELLDKMDQHHKTGDFSNLNLADFEQVRQVLTANHNLIQLKAPGDGVLLYPPKSGDDKTTRITVGSEVKSGQVIALVGDLSGISIEIDVPEVDIDKIHSGMHAQVTGVAFGKEVLQGTLVAINAQASNSSSGGLPSFTALVEVTHLSPKQQLWLKVGMSAAIELQSDSGKQLFVPLAAVTREQGNSVVQVKNKTGALERRIVTTGSVQEGSVVIETGLQEGDVVVYE